jgi:sporulation protein YlmC with PRC-barrel domain
MNVSKSLLKQPKLAVLAGMVAAVITSYGGAQAPNRDNANRPTAAQPQSNQPTQIARSDTGMQTLKQHLQNESMRVSKLIGMEVQNRSGDNLGEVHDVFRGAAPGQDMQLVVATGGITDQKLVAVSFDDIQVNAEGDELYTSRTRDQLAAAPTVMLDSRAADNAGQRDSTPQSQQRVGDLAGAEVIGSGGDAVGEVEDIVISTAGADTVRAVLQVGGLAGIGEKRISLPLSQLAIERGPDSEPTLRVALDGEALMRMPEFEYEEQTSAL